MWLVVGTLAERYWCQNVSLRVHDESAQLTRMTKIQRYMNIRSFNAKFPPFLYLRWKPIRTQIHGFRYSGKTFDHEIFARIVSGKIRAYRCTKLLTSNWLKEKLSPQVYFQRWKKKERVIRNERWRPQFDTLGAGAHPHDFVLGVPGSCPRSPQGMRVSRSSLHICWDQ